MSMTHCSCGNAVDTDDYLDFYGADGSEKCESCRYEDAIDADWQSARKRDTRWVIAAVVVFLAVAVWVVVWHG